MCAGCSCASISARVMSSSFRTPLPPCPHCSKSTPSHGNSIRNRNVRLTGRLSATPACACHDRSDDSDRWSTAERMERDLLNRAAQYTSAAKGPGACQARYACGTTAVAGVEDRKSRSGMRHRQAKILVHTDIAKKQCLPSLLWKQALQQR
jgi:hypothetical protein